MVIIPASVKCPRERIEIPRRGLWIGTWDRPGMSECRHGPQCLVVQIVLGLAVEMHNLGGESLALQDGDEIRTVLQGDFRT